MATEIHPSSSSAAAAEADPAPAHGTMEIREQERTFAGFLWLAGRAALVVIGLLVFLALITL